MAVLVGNRLTAVNGYRNASELAIGAVAPAIGKICPTDYITAAALGGIVVTTAASAASRWICFVVVIRVRTAGVGHVNFAIAIVILSILTGWYWWRATEA